MIKDLKKYHEDAHKLRIENTKTKILNEIRKGNLTLVEIGYKFKVSPRYISEVLLEYNYRQKDPFDWIVPNYFLDKRNSLEDTETLKNLYLNQLKTQGEIAKIFGVSQSAVSQKLSQLGIKKPKEHSRKYLNKTIRTLKRLKKKHFEEFKINSNLEFNDIWPIPEKCPVLGLLLDYSCSHGDDNYPTVDKIIPEKGYVKGNVQIISNRANRLKNNASLEELKQIVKYVEKNTKNSQ